MSKKVLTGAMAAIMATGMVTPAMAATQDELYVAAFKAMEKAVAEKTQAAINEFRVAAKALLAVEDLSDAAKNDLATWSELVDGVQLPLMVEVVDFLKGVEAGKAFTQAEVNAVYNSIKDMPEEYTQGAAFGWSQKTDEAQDKLTKAALDAVTNAKTQAELDAAKALVADLATSVNGDAAAAAGVLETKIAEKEEAIKVVEISSVKVVDVNKVEIKFNKAVDTTKAVVKLTKGLANYNVTATWNAEKDTVVITSVLSKLPTGDYSVVVEGLTDKALTLPVKVEDEKAASLKVNTTQVDVGNKATVYFDVLNQYGTKLKVTASTFTVTAPESIADVEFTAVVGSTSSDAKGNLKADITINNATGKLKAGDKFKVVGVYEGLTATADITFVDAVKLSEVSFGQVQPAQNKTRIYVKDTGLVLPYTAVDQYGNSIKLNATSLKDIKFVSSNNDVIDPSTLSVDADGKLTLNAGTKAGTAIVTGILPDGKTTQFSVTVEAEAYANSVTISAPSVLVAAGETAALDIVVLNQFGEVIPNKDVTGLTFSNGFAINVKTGKLEGKVAAANTAFKVTATRNAGVGTTDAKELASVTFAVEAGAVATSISSVSFPTVFEKEASKTITKDDVVVLDQYGRKIEAQTVTLVAKDSTNTNFSETTASTIKAEKVGTEVYTVKVVANNIAETSAVKDITVKAIESKDITSYALAAIGTIYVGDNYAATPVLTGKTASGESVVLKADKIVKLTSSDESVAIVKDLKIVGTYAGTAESATATIKAWAADGTLLGTSDVTVTKKAPVLTTIVASTTGSALAGDIFVAKDQYGKEFAEQGTWYFTDSKGVISTATEGSDNLKEDGGVVLAAGEYTVKFVSKDGNTTVTTVITIK